MKTTIEIRSKPPFTPLIRVLSAPVLAGLLLGLGSINVWSQGQVNFDTRSVGARCFCLNVPLSGPAWFAQLYAAAGTGASDLALAKVGNPVNFRSGVNAGYIQISGVTSQGLDVNPVVTVPTTGPGGTTTVQLRAWHSNYDTYEQSIGRGIWGKSATLSLTATGNPQGTPPTPPVDLTGLQGFNLCIPEPSTHALLAAGGLILLLALRRKETSTLQP